MNALREVTRRAISAQSVRQATNASLTEWGHGQVSSADTWRPVHDRDSGMTYYWNTFTGKDLVLSKSHCSLDETTALGAMPPSLQDPHPRFTTSRTSELIQMGFIGFGFGLVIAVVHKIL